MIEDILLEVFGGEKPSNWERTTAWSTAQTIKSRQLAGCGRSDVTATIRVAYFDRDGKKSELAAGKICTG